MTVIGGVCTESCKWISVVNLKSLRDLPECPHSFLTLTEDKGMEGYVAGCHVKRGLMFLSRPLRVGLSVDPRWTVPYSGDAGVWLAGTLNCPPT